MPNWCYNEIMVKGHPDDIKKISNILQNQEKKEDFGLFQSLIGLPEGTDIEKYESYECDYWYDINVDWFGTKWDVSLEFVDEIKDDYILLKGETAWSPPINFCKELSERYNVQVEMYFEEPGCDFCGKCWIEPELGSLEEVYDYHHGVYRFEGFQEWYDRYWDSLSDYLLNEQNEDDSPNFKMTILKTFPFLNEEEIEKLTQELKKLFETQIVLAS